MRALIALPIVVILTACATPYVEERPGNPDDNVCTPCATAARWNRPAPNPCPCPDDGDDADGTAAEGVLPP